MSAGSRVGSYFQYAWKGRTAVSLSVQPAVPWKRRQVVKYTISPTVEWTATPRVLKLRMKESPKVGTIFWTLS